MTAPNQPVFTIPSAPGQLSNKRGTNTGGDTLLLTTRYSNPSSADKPAGVRVAATLSQRSGAPTSQLVWDSGWEWDSTTTRPPASALNPGVNQCTSAIYGNRVYVLGQSQTGVYALQSAALSGGAVGTWRLEPTLPVCYGWPVMTILPQLGRMILISGDTTTVAAFVCYTAAIDPATGVVGFFTRTTAPPFNANPVGLAICAASKPSDGTGTQVDTVIIAGGANTSLATPTNKTYIANVSPDGTIGAASWTAGANLATAVSGAFLFWDPIIISGASQLYVVGGRTNATTCTTSVQQATLGLGGGSPSAIATWTATGSPLPAARAYFAGIYLQNVGTVNGAAPPNPIGRLWVIGGESGAAGAYTTTVYSADVDNTVVGPGPFAARTALGQSVGAAPAGWMMGGQLPAAKDAAYPLLAAMPLADPLNAFPLAYGGGNQAATPSPVVWTAPNQNGQLDPGTWGNGVGTVLSTTNLGAGAAVVTNNDGTVDVTFAYAAFGNPAAQTGGTQGRYGGLAGAPIGFTDGDQVQVALQFVDVNGGDGSPVNTTTIRIGQPPTVTGVPANASTPAGAFTATLTYTPGAGGGPEASWRIQEKLN